MLRRVWFRSEVKTVSLSFPVELRMARPALQMGRDYFPTSAPPGHMGTGRGEGAGERENTLCHISLVACGTGDPGKRALFVSARTMHTGDRWSNRAFLCPVTLAPLSGGGLTKGCLEGEARCVPSSAS